jgi:hypothetical protein
VLKSKFKKFFKKLGPYHKIDPKNKPKKTLQVSATSRFSPQPNSKTMGSNARATA